MHMHIFNMCMLGVDFSIFWTNPFFSEGKDSPPQRVLLLEELVDVLQLTLPDLCKLGLSYFSASIVAEVSKQ